MWVNIVHALILHKCLYKVILNHTIVKSSVSTILQRAHCSAMNIVACLTKSTISIMHTSPLYCSLSKLIWLVIFQLTLKAVRLHLCERVLWGRPRVVQCCRFSCFVHPVVSHGWAVQQCCQCGHSKLPGWVRVDLFDLHDWSQLPEGANFVIQICIHH